MHYVCRYAPNIEPTSNSAYPVEIMRILRLAEEAPPAIVATLYEAQKTVHQPGIVAKLLEPAAEMVRADAGFHANQTWRHIREPCFHLAT
jgi:hypothetical protein